MRQFIKYIDNKVTTKNVDKLHNLLFNCCSSISHILKQKTNIDKKKFIELFSNIFASRLNYNQVYNQINNQINGIVTGNADTFNQYIANRNNLFEKTDKNLKENVSKNIIIQNENYFTVPIPTKSCSNNFYDNYILFETPNISDFVHYRIGVNIYKHGALSIDNYNFPILPSNKIITNLEINQHIRQWIRAIYSNFYNIKPNSDFLLYMFLTDMLKLIISNVDTNVKSAYRNLGLIMLDRVRFNSGGVKEIKYLREGNSPLPNSGKKDEMIEMFTGCSNRAFGNNGLRPYTLWYAIVLAIDDPKLIENQLEHCIADLTMDFPMIQDYTCLLDMLSEKYKIKYLKYTLKPKIDLDYTCYLTLDDTSETGGYKIISHKVSKRSNTICDPKFVITGEAYSMLSKEKIISCPICIKKLTINDFALINPKMVDKEDCYVCTDAIDWFKTSNHDVISPTSMFQTIDSKGNFTDTYSANTLLPIDVLNFNTKSYEIKDFTLAKTMDKTCIEITTSDDFTNVISKNYGFLRCMDWSNMCIAGGFMKSILLNQTVNDIDLFLYAINKEDIPKKINHIISVLKNYYPDKYVLLAQKKDNHVIEILIIDIIDIDDYFRADNTTKFINWKFKDEYEEPEPEPDPETEILNVKRTSDAIKTVVFQDQDPEKVNNVKSTKDNYFNQLKNKNYSREILSKFRIVTKIQIITKEKQNINDIIDNFDLSSCMVAYDGSKILFNEKGYLSFKYMINVFYKNYNNINLSRLIKYFNNGFNIVLHNHSNDSCDLCNNFVHYDNSKQNKIKYNDFNCHFQNTNVNFGIVDSFEFIKTEPETEDTDNISNSFKYTTITGDKCNNKALIYLLRYAEMKNSTEKNNIIWDIYDLNKDNNIFNTFLSYVEDLEIKMYSVDI